MNQRQTSPKSEPISRLANSLIRLQCLPKPYQVNQQWAMVLLLFVLGSCWQESSTIWMDNLYSTSTPLGKLKRKLDDYDHESSFTLRKMRIAPLTYLGTKSECYASLGSILLSHVLGIIHDPKKELKAGTTGYFLDQSILFASCIICSHNSSRWVGLPKRI